MKKIICNLSIFTIIFVSILTSCDNATQNENKPQTETIATIARSFETTANTAEKTTTTKKTTTQKKIEVKLPEKSDDGRIIFNQFPGNVNVFPEILPREFTADETDELNAAYEEFFDFLYKSYNDWYAYDYNGDFFDISVVKNHANIQKETTDELKSLYSKMIKLSGILEDFGIAEKEFDKMLADSLIIFYSDGLGWARGFYSRAYDGTDIIMLNSYFVGAFTFVHEWWHLSGFGNEGMVEYLTHATFLKFPQFTQNKGRSPFGGGDSIHSNSNQKSWEYSDRKFQIYELCKLLGEDSVAQSMRYDDLFEFQATLSQMFANDKFIKLIDDNVESFSGELFGKKIESILYELYMQPNVRYGFVISDGKNHIEFPQYSIMSFENTFTQCLVLLLKDEHGEEVDSGQLEWAREFITALEDLNLDKIEVKPL